MWHEFIALNLQFEEASRHLSADQQLGLVIIYTERTVSLELLDCFRLFGYSYSNE
jgi:hypothetical protein